jgi:hypothetical protein
MEFDNIKTYLLSGLVVFAGTLIVRVFLNNYSPTLTKYITYAGMAIAFGLIIGGVMVGFKGKFLNKEPAKSHDEIIKEYQTKLEQQRIMTDIKEQEMLQKQYDNKIALQKAQINAINVKLGGKQAQGTGQNILNNLGNLCRPQQQKPMNTDFIKPVRLDKINQGVNGYLRPPSKRIIKNSQVDRGLL